MSAIQWDSGTTWDGGVMFAQGIGEIVDLSAAALVIQSIMAGGAASAEAGAAGEWPIEPIGSSHTLVVPSFGGKNDLFRPSIFRGDRDIYAVSFRPNCLDPMNDDPDKLLECAAQVSGVDVACRVAVGGAVPEDGIVQVAVGNAAMPGQFPVRLQISTKGGRKISALFSVTVLP